MTGRQFFWLLLYIAVLSYKWTVLLVVTLPRCDFFFTGGQFFCLLLYLAVIFYRKTVLLVVTVPSCDDSALHCSSLYQLTLCGSHLGAAAQTQASGSQGCFSSKKFIPLNLAPPFCKYLFHILYFTSLILRESLILLLLHILSNLKDMKLQASNFCYYNNNSINIS